MKKSCVNTFLRNRLYLGRRNCFSRDERKSPQFRPNKGQNRHVKSDCCQQMNGFPGDPSRNVKQEPNFVINTISLLEELIPGII